MSVFHDLQDITLEVDFSIKVRIVELLHGDLGTGSFVFAEVGIFEIDIVVQGSTGKGDFFVDSSTVFGSEPPIADGQRDKEDHKEDPVECPSGFEG